MNRTKVIGTGLSGLIGSRAVELLSDSFCFVDLSLESGVDILNRRMLEKSFDQHKDATIVLHLAAFTDTNAAWIQRGNTHGACYQLNVIATRNVVNLCKEHGMHLIHASTDYVFSGTKNGQYTETDKPDPVEWYGYTKSISEEIVQNSLPSFSIIRPSFPYRASFANKSDIVRKSLTNLISGTSFPMFTNQIITPTFVDDIILGLRYFFENTPKGIYHLVGSSSHSPYEICIELATVFKLSTRSIKPTTLEDYEKSLLPNARPWQHNLSLSNEKVTGMGIAMSTLSEGLTKMRSQMT